MVTKKEKDDMAAQTKLSYAQFKKIKISFALLLEQFEIFCDFMIKSFDTMSPHKKGQLLPTWFNYYIGVRDEYILLHYGVIVREQLAYARFIGHKSKSFRDLHSFIESRPPENSLEQDPHYTMVNCSERGIMHNLKQPVSYMLSAAGCTLVFIAESNTGTRGAFKINSA